MPRQVDRESRRRLLAQAVWRLVLRDGVRAASVRGVATEAGLAVGSVRHYFASQDELLRFAVTELLAQAHDRIAAGTGHRDRLIARGRVESAALDLIEQALPLDEQRRDEALVWNAFTAAPSGDPVMAELRRQVDAEVRLLCRNCLTGLRELGRMLPGRQLAVETERLHALIDGLTLHLLHDPASITAGQARTVLRQHLRDLASPTTRAG